MELGKWYSCLLVGSLLVPDGSFVGNIEFRLCCLWVFYHNISFYGNVFSSHDLEVTCVGISNGILLHFILFFPFMVICSHHMTRVHRPVHRPPVIYSIYTDHLSFTVYKQPGVLNCKSDQAGN